MAVVEEAEEEEEEDVEVELFRPLDLLLFLVLGMQMQVLFYIFLSGVEMFLLCSGVIFHCNFLIFLPDKLK